MTKVQIGSIIKAYDFPGTTDCYIIGKVINVTDVYITANVIKAVSEDKEYDLCSATFKTPLQGKGLLDDKFDRVIVLG